MDIHAEVMRWRKINKLVQEQREDDKRREVRRPLEQEMERVPRLSWGEGARDTILTRSIYR